MRIQYKYFCFSAMSFLAVLSTLYLFWATLWDNKVGKFFWAVLGTMVICEFVYDVFKAILWTSRARRFKYHFSISAPNSPDMDWKQISANQPIVDNILESTAVIFNDAIQQENELLEKKPVGLIDAQDRAIKIANQSLVVEIEKKYFWDVHKLAWEWGFYIYDSHKDYVNPLDRAGKEKHRKQF